MNRSLDLLHLEVIVQVVRSGVLVFKVIFRVVQLRGPDLALHGTRGRPAAWSAIPESKCLAQAESHHESTAEELNSRPSCARRTTQNRVALVNVHLDNLPEGGSLRRYLLTLPIPPLMT